MIETLSDSANTPEITERIGVGIPCNEADFIYLQRRLYQYFLRKTEHNFQDSEDLTQITLAKVFKGLPNFQKREGVPFESWVFAIARNRLGDYRKTGRLWDKRILSDDIGEFDGDFGLINDNSPEDEVIALEDQREVREAFDLLSEEERNILDYRYAEDLQHQFIARKLNRSTSAVKSSASRAMKRLRIFFSLRNSELIKPAGKSYHRGRN